MIFCENCFKDNEIRSMIKSYSKKGQCDLCGVTDIFVYDTDDDEYLTDLFEGLFDIYVDVDNISGEFDIPDLPLLKNELKRNWDIFSESKTPYMIERIISNVSKEYFASRPELLSKPVGILKAFDKEYLTTNSIVGEYDWDTFVKSIKDKYRFHTDIFVKRILKEYCKYLIRVIKKGDVFHRARISGKEGYELDKMGAPPVAVVSAGRINPDGMSYLYLADSPETTIYETRASLHDYVCIGEFVALEDIKIIDLTGLERISVFYPDLDYAFHAINRVHIKRINDEIAKPVRSSDSHLEYLPTQYICDYIKSIVDEFDSEKQAYQGIMYKSTMIDDSYNVAIFDPELLECTDKEVRCIRKVEYKF